jgi:hypothetical protein
MLVRKTFSSTLSILIRGELFQFWYSYPMANTFISPLIHSPEEHAIVALPDSVSIQRIVKIQTLIKSVLGDIIWLTPPNTLHSTLMEIVCDTEYTGLSRKEYFRHWYDRYNDATSNVIAQFRPIDVTFSELYVSPGAIILKAVDPKPLNDVRAALLEHIVLPEQTKLPPDIAHCSVARYNEAVDLEEVRERVRRVDICVDVGLHISEFKLVRDLGLGSHPIVEEVYSLSEWA